MLCHFPMLIYECCRIDEDPQLKILNRKALRFRHLLDRYGLKGFAYGSYVDITCFPNRALTEEEILQISLMNLEIARRLGIWMVFELYAPNHWRDAMWTRLFQTIDEFGPNVMSMVLDTGILMPGLTNAFWMRLYCWYIHGKYVYIGMELRKNSAPFDAIVPS